MYDEAQDAVAAEYVLGTLSADEREHAEALLAIDPGFADAVHMWERRLGELNVMVEAVEPPPPLWDKIRAQITDAAPASESSLPAIADVASIAQRETSSGDGQLSPMTEAASTVLPSSDEQPLEQSSALPAMGAAQSSSEAVAEPVAAVAAAKIERSAVVYLSRRVNFWRQMTMAAAAIAVLLAIFGAVAVMAPGRLGLKVAPAPVAQGPAPLGARLVAALQQGPTGPAFLLTVDPQRRNLIVRRVSATPETGRSYELWLMSSRFPAPRSLGVVGSDEYTERAIPSGIDVDAIRGASYAVSLEPAGGSPSGAPSGPILFTGKLVEAVPTAAPSAASKPRT
jgi:anti-sigma-K factor RskA